VALLKGDSTAVINENIRTLKGQGLDEAEATKRAAAHARGQVDSVHPAYRKPLLSTNETDPRPKSVDKSPTSGSDSAHDATSSGRRWVIVTKDFSGLGWAAALQREGESVTLAVENPEEDPEAKAQFDHVGEGWFDVVPLRQVLKSPNTETYYLFDTNSFPKEADRLRQQGCKVWGTSALSEKLEHDRHYAVEIAAQAGLPAPETQECATREEGLTFLDENPDRAWVFKPDEGGASHLTFVPVLRDDSEANRETYTYLQHMHTEPGSFVLQERIQGTECNVELWLDHGSPCLAFVTLEAKRRNVGDLGEMSGCAGDLVWIVPVEDPLVVATIGKLLPFYVEQDYTGWADVNVILTPNGPRFLEVCNRYGYNGHVTLFLGLANQPFGDIMAMVMDGDMSLAPAWFRPGYAASLTLFLDHPCEGLPVHLMDEEHYFPFDGYREDGQLLLAGYSPEVGIYVSMGATPDAALKAGLTAVRDHEMVSFPNMHYRTDLASTGYPNAILTRWEQLKGSK
jgi:phosphoribosylamine-glycine ligase